MQNLDKLAIWAGSSEFIYSYMQVRYQFMIVKLAEPSVRLTDVATT